MGNASHKKNGYEAQKKWAKQNELCSLSFYTYQNTKLQIQQLARANGMSISKLVLNALAQCYGIDLSTPRQSDDPK